MKRIPIRCGARCRGCDRRVGTLHLVLNLNLAAVETVVGILSGSKALAVCALFSLRGCILAGIVAASAARTRNPAVSRREAVRGKIEFLVAAGMSMSSLVGVAALCYALLHTILFHPLAPPSWAAAWVALASATACWLMADHADCAAARAGNRALATHAEQSRGHAYVAAAVLVAVVVTRMGYSALDSITAVVLAAGAIWRSWRVLRRSIAGLLDASVGGETHSALVAALATIDALPGPASVSATWIGRGITARVTVQVEGAMPMSQADRSRARIEAALRKTVPEVKEVLVGYSPAGGTRFRSTARSGTTEHKAIRGVGGGAVLS